MAGQKREVTTTDFLQAIYHGTNLRMINFVLTSRLADQFLTTTDQNGLTAILIAVRKGHTEIVSLLLQKNASCKDVDKRGYTALHIAAEQGHLAIISVLLKVNSFATLVNDVPHNHITTFKKVGNWLGGLAGQEKRDNSHDFHTPLLIAAEEGHFIIVEYLITHGASIKAKDINGNTPLLLATAHGHLEVVKLLLNKGASLQEENSEGLTAFDISEQMKHQEILNFIKIGLYDPFNYIPYGNLTFERELGRGGSGVIYHGFWGKSSDVAIKKILIIGGELLPEFLDDFKRETKILSTLTHPKIIQFYGISLHEQNVCMVMEYSSKGDLHTLLTQPEKPSWQLRVQLSLDIAEGLAFLHNKQIIHRDLKPRNVLITENNRAKLIDFGLAKVKTQITKSLGGTIGIGTANYIAPELVSNEKGYYTRKTDIFALGILLWEMSSCQEPFASLDHVAKVMRHLIEGKREEISAETPPEYAALIARCWAQRAADRPTTETVVEELHSLYQTFGVN